MTTAIIEDRVTDLPLPENTNSPDQLALKMAAAWQEIAPVWPLKNMVAVNPLQGLEDLPLEKALQKGRVRFQQKDLPDPLYTINRISIKWLQAFADEGQATIPMPSREQGLYRAWRQLVIYDDSLHQNDNTKRQWLQNLPTGSQEAIALCLHQLQIPQDQQTLFLSLMLTTLPGWASWVQYRTSWAGLDADHPHPVSKADYLALRLVITTLIWPEAKKLLAWHDQVEAKEAKDTTTQDALYAQMQQAEATYRQTLLSQLAGQSLQAAKTPPAPQERQAQLVFCIDVRSEPFRRALEATGKEQGRYQTLGFAGFFGIPVQITNSTTGETHASCPVLLAPQHEITESPCTSMACQQDRKGHAQSRMIKKLYQSVKYNFTTPFALVEGLGVMNGIWMGLRSLFPGLAARVHRTASQTIHKPTPVKPVLDSLSLVEQCQYAEGALHLMGLTKNFAPLVVFCGHGSTTTNNAYATALDCGACGGGHGGSNARILATILNHGAVRAHLAQQGITIPQDTHFMAGEHDTTTDEFTLYEAVNDQDISEKVQNIKNELKRDLQMARITNSMSRARTLDKNVTLQKAAAHSWLRAQDWAQIRPEWGLARNAAFVVGPRGLTENLDLDGRVFLHSYDYQQDGDASALTVILTAPMVVTQWINTQYLFSTWDNIAYGGGSKITKNITGKMAIMQGNASDLMTGLPLQSVYKNDKAQYHQPQRLLTVVYAPPALIDRVISAQEVLQKLFGNGWVQLACIDPQSQKVYELDRELSWQETP